MSQSQPRPFLPKNLRKFAMQQMHFAHKGIKESVRVIATHYYWTDMKAEITRYVQTCHGCQSVKPSHTTPPHYGTFQVPDRRFSHCHVDIVGPLPESEGYKYLLTIIDRTTRQLSALPVPEPSAKTCSQAFLLHYVALYGLPSACTSDQGSNFVSALFQEMQRGLGIKINHTPIYWPQGNGLVERNHQSLKDSIKAQLVELGEKHQDKWIYFLPWALLGRRTAFNANLGTSSSELTFGKHISVPGCLLPDTPKEEPDIQSLLRHLNFKDTRPAVPTSKNPQKPIPPPPESITHVYTRQHDTRGLQSRFKGPFLIVARPSRSTLEIKVGVNKDLTDRTELRSWADVKPAYLKDEVVEAERPKRGRPPKAPSPSSPEVETSSETPSDTSPPSNNNKAEPSTDVPSRNLNQYNLRPRSNVNYSSAIDVTTIDFSKPPPLAGNSNVVPTHAEPTTGPPPFSGFINRQPWSASLQELASINQSIGGTRTF